MLEAIKAGFMKIPVLLLGSREDEMCRKDLAQEYGEVAALIPNAAIRIFEQGGHPAIRISGNSQ